ncbi:hypothetical protein EDD58_101270 [Hazenella coriacea]|uniref:Uncharacterized protein n=1 Tax=Hazenella coriacea TaxID=1179467 RepID=A0A4R3LE73_9BACL|nr:hypothetical protein EDD58_101270 [Hazenella coriacea]
MKVTETKRHSDRMNENRLHQVSLSVIWPTLPFTYLAYLELEQDELFSKIPDEKIPQLIQLAMEHGEKAAKKFAKNLELTFLINTLLKQGVRVRFFQHQPANSWIRAQYIRKPPSIEIYRSSLSQMETFFREMKQPVGEKDLIQLHLVHEWFHHLEETKIQRTDLILPRAKQKIWGPFVSHKPIRRLREIAAHTFTEQVLKLTWSPLLLDHLLLLKDQGKSRLQIREYFQSVRQRVEPIFHPPAPPSEELDQSTH